jgi:hypothetical protein
MHMKRRTVATIIAAVGLVACNPVSTDYVREYEPAEAKRIPGTELYRVTLEESAVERLGLETTPIRTARSGGAQKLVMPYDALLYDANGVAWTYTQEGPLTFVRDHILVERVDGNRVWLSKGPPSGTRVVTVGVPELLGIETGVGH